MKTVYLYFLRTTGFAKKLFYRPPQQGLRFFAQQADDFPLNFIFSIFGVAW